MLTIFLALSVSLVAAFFATQSSTTVSLTLGDIALTNIPLFFVVLVSILIGMLVASVVTVINLIKSKLTIFGQKNELKKSYNTVSELRGRVSELEGENMTFREQIQQLAPRKKVPGD